MTDTQMLTRNNIPTVRHSTHSIHTGSTESGQVRIDNKTYTERQTDNLALVTRRHIHRDRVN